MNFTKYLGGGSLRYLSRWMLVMFIILMLCESVWAAEPQINGKASILIDAQSGQVLYGKNIHTKLYPASTTKILTAILALENGNLTDMVKVGANPPKVEGTKVYLREGEQVTLEQLLNAALIKSANDAALAIAEYIGGTEENFVKMMNDKAKEIGCKETTFNNSHGLTDEKHLTSAYDLSLMGKYAMQNEIFRSIVIKKTYDWDGVEWQSRLINLNKLLWRMPEATGIKPGYTTQAKNTLVASAKKDGKELICVILGVESGDIYNEAKTLLEYGFNNFQSINLVDKEKMIASVSYGKDKNVDLISNASLSVTLPKGQKADVQKKVVLNNTSLPVKKGDILGELVVVMNGAEKGRIPLRANSDIKKQYDYVRWVVNFVAGLYIFQILFRLVRLLTKKRRKQVRTSKRISSIR